MNKSSDPAIPSKSLQVHVEKTAFDSVHRISARKRKSVFVKKETSPMMENDENEDLCNNEIKPKENLVQRKRRMMRILEDFRLEEEEEMKREIEEKVLKKKFEVLMLLKIRELLNVDVILKLSYSECHYDVGTLLKTMDHILESSYFRDSDLLFLVPSLISTLIHLSSPNVDQRVRSKANAVLAVVWEMTKSSVDSENSENVSATYFAQSAEALRKNPQFDVQKFRQNFPNDWD